MVSARIERNSRSIAAVTDSVMMQVMDGDCRDGVGKEQR